MTGVPYPIRLPERIPASKKMGHGSWYRLRSALFGHCGRRAYGSVVRRSGNQMARMGARGQGTSRAALRLPCCLWLAARLQYT